MQKYPQAATAGTSSTKTRKVGNRQSYSHAKADVRKRRKQDEAAERQLHYESLSLNDKLKTCKPGGSKKQRTKLEALLAQVKKDNQGVKSAPVTVKKKSVDKAKKESEMVTEAHRVALP